MKFLSLDVGTTCCKCQVFSGDGEILFYKSIEYALKKIGSDMYVDVNLLLQTVKELVKNATENHDINSIAVSSFGEAFALLDKDDKLLFYPMLYTDVRGKEQAKKIKKKFGEKFLYQTTGVIPHAMYSISKLLWIKENHPQIFKKADKVLLMGDYVGYMLSKKRVIDYSLAARTGVFDIQNKRFNEKMLAELGIDKGLFSTPLRAGSVVGTINQEIAKELNIGSDCKLVLGSHDQVCSALGAGVIKAGQAADGMGTVECITALYHFPPKSQKFGRMGYPTVPFAVDGLYCTYILNYSSGSLVNWFKNQVCHAYTGGQKNFFEYIEKNVKDKPSDVLLLPYFAGAATPYQDGNAKGAILNLTLGTKDGDIYRAILEGTSYEMKLNLEVVKEFGIGIDSAIATGGGANSNKWLKIKADVTGLKLKNLRSAEGGLCGVAMLQSVALNNHKDLEDAKKTFVRYDKEFLPSQEDKQIYDEKYQKYKKIYKTLKEIN